MSSQQSDYILELNQNDIKIFQERRANIYFFMFVLYAIINWLLSKLGKFKSNVNDLWLVF